MTPHACCPPDHFITPSDDCQNCLARRADEHTALAEIFRVRLLALRTAKKCSVYDTTCLNPDYCAQQGACCAGDPGCTVAGTLTSNALCHECSEMVEIIDGRLAPHHGTTGEGCPLNNTPVQIYLHPRVADRIAHLTASLVFG